VAGSVIVFTGMPGTGKSTLAQRVARAIRAPVFAGDWLLGALKPYGVLDGLDRSAYLAMYYNLLQTLITRQLALGQSAIVDCLVTDDMAARWQTDAARYDSRLLVVECVCTDTDLHRTRVEVTGVVEVVVGVPGPVELSVEADHAMGGAVQFREARRYDVVPLILVAGTVRGHGCDLPSDPLSRPPGHPPGKGIAGTVERPAWRAGLRWRPVRGGRGWRAARRAGSGSGRGGALTDSGERYHGTCEGAGH
jgi:AAA domain